MKLFECEPEGGFFSAPILTVILSMVEIFIFCKEEHPQRHRTAFSANMVKILKGTLLLFPQKKNNRDMLYILDERTPFNLCVLHKVFRESHIIRSTGSTLLWNSFQSFYPHKLCSFLEIKIPHKIISLFEGISPSVICSMFYFISHGEKRGLSQIIIRQER